MRRFFPEQAKQQIQVMVKNITNAFERRIDILDWMAPATKAAAKAKVSTLVVGVGYPDKWRVHTGLGIVRGEALMNRVARRNSPTIASAGSWNSRSRAMNG